MPRKMRMAILCLLATACSTAYAQSVDSAANRVINFPGKLFSNIQSRMARLDKQLTKQTESYVQRAMKQERRLKRRLAQLDSTDTSGSKRSAILFSGDPQQRYNALLQKLKSDTSTASKAMHGEYLPYMDSMQVMLRFLQSNPQLLNNSKVLPSDVQNSLARLDQLQSKIQDAGEIQQFMQQRQSQLQQWLSQYTHLPSGVTNCYTNFNKQLYYYTEQVKAYKEALNDPDKMMRLAMTVLNKVPAFTSFMRSNSMLSSILNLPGTYNPSMTGQGLATRDQVLAAFQNQLGGSKTAISDPSASGSSGPDPSAMVEQNVQSAQGEVDQLRAKLTSYGSSNSADVDIPDFHPNSQKTRSLLRRLEFGVNLQTVHSTFFFPSTTDIGLSMGYKLNDKNVIGIGASYKIGWGKDLSHVSLSSQGVSLRSFLDINIKASFFVTGGFEYNYQQPFRLADMPKLSSWQQSGLLGITKIISLKTKVFKKTKAQLLWDFLSYQQIPKAQPFKFRIGYNF